MKRHTLVCAVAVAGRSSIRRRCANGSHLYPGGPDREDVSPLRSWFGTKSRAGDSLRPMRSVRSTVHSMEGTNAETSRHACGRKDRAMNTHIYTPRLKNTGERLGLKLNHADWVVASRYRGTLRVKG